MKLLRRRTVPPRWFQDEDGTYFRNGRLVLNEEAEWLKLPCTRRVNRELNKLHAEFQVIWRDGITRKDHLDPGDVVVQMARFRDAFPDDPRIWILDND